MLDGMRRSGIWDISVDFGCMWNLLRVWVQVEGWSMQVSQWCDGLLVVFFSGGEGMGYGFL